MTGSHYPLYERLGSLLDDFAPVRFKAGVLGRPIKETHGSVATQVAAQHGVEAVANGFRCPPNRANGGTFTDAMGTTCGVMIAVEAVESAMEAVSQAASGMRLTEGREGGRAAAVVAKNEQILSAIRSAGGSPFNVTPSYANNHHDPHSIFAVLDTATIYERQRETSARFLGHVRDYLRTGNEPEKTGFGNMPSGWNKNHIDSLHPEVKDMIASMSDEELLQVLEDQAFAFHQSVDRNVRVQIPRGQRLESFLDSGSYLTTHDVGSDHSGSFIRADYERQIGFPRDIDNSLRPASGYVTHPEWEQAARELHLQKTGEEPNEFTQLPSGTRGQVGIYGSVELILRPEVGDRTGYGAGDSISTMLRPAAIDETDRTKVFSAIMSQGGKNQSNVGQLALALLESKRSGSFKNVNDMHGGIPDGDPLHDRMDRTYFEALIAGSFGTEDVAAIRIPYSDLAYEIADPLDVQSGKHVADKEKKIKDEFFSTEMLRSMGFSDEEIQYLMGMLDNFKNIDGRKMNIPPQLLIPQLQQLLDFRMARERKAKIESKGIQVQVTHPKSVDPFNPTSYGASPGDDIEKVLLDRFKTALPSQIRADRERQARLAAQEAERIARGEPEPEYG